MNIQIENSSFIEVMEEKGEFILTAYGTNANIIQICNIKRRYIKSLIEELNKIYYTK